MLFFVPCAYIANFIYAVKSDASGGTFGDTFGAANAIFSGTALMMLIYAVILQREELNIIKEERNDTKKLLSGQESINALQEAALRKQSFEQSFFSLVRLISEERRSLDRTMKYGDSTLATQAKWHVYHSVKNSNSLVDWELTDEITEFGTPARLLITAHALLVEQDFSKQDSLQYISTLHALMDADFANVFLTLVARWKNGDPRAVKEFTDVQCFDFLDEELKAYADFERSN